MKPTKYLLLLFTSLGIAIFLRTFIFRTYLVTSNSMSPILHSGDHILSLNVKPTSLSVHSNDIIIFTTFDSSPLMGSNNQVKKELLIKRVVEIKSNSLANQPSFFVLGDNTNISISKTKIGEVFYSNVVGLPILLYYPLNRMTWLH